jgi:hypothetical protein
MQKVVLAVITVAVMAFAGCSGDDGSGDVKCSETGICPKDTAPTEPYLSSCQATLASTCGSEWQAVLNCVKANEKCDASGNMDLTATEAACSTQLGNFASCCTTNPTAAGCQ